MLGVRFPTEYGYIKGYTSEDGHDLDVFVGSGKVVGYMHMKRDDSPNGIETKPFSTFPIVNWRKSKKHMPRCLVR